MTETKAIRLTTMTNSVTVFVALLVNLQMLMEIDCVLVVLLGRNTTLPPKAVILVLKVGMEIWVTMMLSAKSVRQGSIKIQKVALFVSLVFLASSKMQKVLYIVKSVKLRLFQTRLN